MTEVPEHLLERSRARRAALGLGGDGGDAPSAAASSAEAVETTSAAPAATAAAPKAAVEPAEAAPPKPPPPYVQASLDRKRIPIWTMPVLALLPVWAVLYLGFLSPSSTGEITPLAQGAEIYTGKCSSCHGPTGGGGVGRPLADGEVIATFPTIEGQLEYVSLGTTGFGSGLPYGDPGRAGGQHVAGSFGQMPAFGTDLTGEELLAVVRHERETLSGEEVPPEELDADGNRLWPNGEPMLDDAGELIGPDGEPLFDDTGRLVALSASQ